MGNLTLFEAQTGGAFDRLTGNIAGNLTKIFQRSQMPGGLPGGGMGGFGIDRYIRPRSGRCLGCEDEGLSRKPNKRSNPGGTPI